MNITTFDFIIILLIAVMGIIGYARGAINTLISFLGMIASFVIAKLLAPVISEKLIATDFVQKMISDFSANAMNQLLQEYSSSSLQTFAPLQDTHGIGSVLSGLQNGEALLTGSLTPVMESIMSIVLFFAVFILCSLCLTLIRHLGKGINKVPVLGFANRLAGLVIGAVMALVICWVILYLMVLYALFSGDAVLIQDLAGGILTGPLISAMI